MPSLSTVSSATDKAMMNLVRGGRGWRDWLLALLTLYLVFSGVGAAMFLASPICPGSLSPIDLLTLPAIPVTGFFLTCLMLFSLVTADWNVAIIGTTALMIGVGLLTVSAQFRLRGGGQRHSSLWRWLLFLTILATFASLSTLAFCFSLTA